MKHAMYSSKNRKRIIRNRILFVLIILLALAVIGGCVYGAVYWAKSQVELGSTLTIEGGVDEIPSALDYFKKTGHMKEDDLKIEYSGEGEAQWEESTVDGKTVATGLGAFEVTITNTKNDKTYTTKLTVEDTTAPELTVQNVTVEFGDEYEISNFVVSVNDAVDGVDCEITYSKAGEGEDTQVGEYTYHIVATDKSGNTSKGQEVTLTIEKGQIEQSTETSANPYYIKINRALNCVTIYKADSNGKYTIPVKAMVCSTGTATPVGVFNTTDKYTWRLLEGNVYGQYATRIVDHILFHSVPYYTQDKSDLEYEEYNKLGEEASLGCIRLSVEDCKWIYDNCPKGTTVEIYDDTTNPGPLGKPEGIKIDTTSPNRGWDPTDPDPANPWNK